MGYKRRDEVCLVHSRLAVPESYRKRKIRSGTYTTSMSVSGVMNGKDEETHASYEYVIGGLEYK